MKFSELDEFADGKILAGVVGNIGYLVINNPERRNAISLSMYEAAAAQVMAMAVDPCARLLVIRGGGGKAFASGADISKFEKERASSDDVAIYSAATKTFYDAVFSFPKPWKVPGVMLVRPGLLFRFSVWSCPRSWKVPGAMLARAGL